MIGRHFRAALLLVCGGALAVPAAHAAAIVNGNFETGDTTGWNVTGSAYSSGLYQLNPFGTAYGAGFSGSYWAWLGGYERPISFDQTITGLNPGSSYAVNFIMASEFSASDSLLVSVGGGPQTMFTAPAYNTNGDCSNGGCFWNNWVNQTFDFTATGTAEDLQFSTYGIYGVISQYDVGLDNVTINQVGGSVPEPGSLALLALGLGALALASRKRRWS